MHTVIRILKPYSGLLLSLTLLLLLLLARMCWHGNLQYAFLFWNIFLAVLPLPAAHIARRARQKLTAFLAAGCWLLFFPNAAYLITDIVHLQMRRSPSFWLDLTILFGAGLFGMVAAMRSLLIMEQWYGRFLGRPLAVLLSLLLLAISGYGIYLGRVERWNSWDIICNPIDLLSSIAYEFRHPFRCRQVWALSGVFAAALTLAYFTLGRRQLKA